MLESYQARQDQVDCFSCVRIAAGHMRDLKWAGHVHVNEMYEFVEAR